MFNLALIKENKFLVGIFLVVIIVALYVVLQVVNLFKDDGKKEAVEQAINVTDAKHAVIKVTDANDGLVKAYKDLEHERNVTVKVTGEKSAKEADIKHTVNGLINSLAKTHNKVYTAKDDIHITVNKAEIDKHSKQNINTIWSGYKGVSDVLR